MRREAMGSSFLTRLHITAPLRTSQAYTTSSCCEDTSCERDTPHPLVRCEEVFRWKSWQDSAAAEPQDDDEYETNESGYGRDDNQSYMPTSSPILRYQEQHTLQTVDKAHTAGDRQRSSMFAVKVGLYKTITAISPRGPRQHPYK